MKANTMALLLGGLLPAILFGVSGVFQKTSAKAGMGTGPYLMVIGFVVVVVGGVVAAVQRDATVNWTRASYACAYGLLWAAGIACIAVAVGRFDGQISQLVPLYNMNTLVAVAVGLVFLSEWRNVQVGLLLLATGLTIAGGVLAAAAVK
jgi:uncharacterized membrane protein